MELAVYPSVGDFDSRLARFCAFCLYAQYQLEPLLRYYFQKAGGAMPSGPKGQGEGSYRQMLLEIGRRHYAKSNGTINYKDRYYNTFEQLRCFRNLIVHQSALPTADKEFQALMKYRSKHFKLLKAMILMPIGTGMIEALRPFC